MSDEGSRKGLEERASALPQSSGVYLFKSARGKVLYVGKAQNLRSRVRSYLTGGDGRHQVPRLVERAADVEVLVTPNVKDALLLENELIKQHKPPFNVRLRDDKQYLALRLDLAEEWPRLTMVRRFKKDGARYFGPYTSSTGMRQSLSNLRRIFPLRTCSDPVFRDYQRRGRPCIEHEMGRCPGPCVGLVTTEAYRELVDGTEMFLRGRSSDLMQSLRERMEEAAREEKFEEAARLRDQLAAVEHTVEKQQIVSERPVDRDVFGLARDGGEVELRVLHVREGRVIGSLEQSFSDVRLDDGDVMGSFLGQYYAGHGAERQVPGEILESVGVDDEGALEAFLTERAGHRVSLKRPSRGAPRELVALAVRNAELALQARLEARESVIATLEEIQERLSLSTLPRRIECYDVSNLQGTLAVASRVAFEDGQPDKNEYRRYRIKDAPAGDDFACMREVIQRRLARREKEPLPDLLVVDGGRGQLGVVSAALRDEGVELDHLGLSKERDEASPSLRVRRGGGLKAERVFLPGRKDAVMLPPSSRGLLLLQRVRDEAHRFAIEFQRSLRQRVGMTSILEELPGIGPKKRRALLRELGSLKAVRGASVEELAQVTGISEADARGIHDFFAALRSLEAEGEGARDITSDATESAPGGDPEPGQPDAADPPEGTQLPSLTPEVEPEE
ncbi:MAG: excinuclease ABC subunit UvrC [Myxococcota bacterium]|nr:excinuclease ABC subunit UvrC [Myxococcota bacterium]